MATTDSDRHFDKVIIPSVARFRIAERELVVAYKSGDEDRLDAARDEAIRAARNAVIELHHQSDVVWAERPSWVPSQIQSLDALRLWAQSAYCRMLRGQPVDDLDLLSDIADAMKHHATTHKPRRRDRKITSAKAIITTGSGWGELSRGEGNYGGVEQVLVLLHDGRKRALSSVLQNVLDAWRLARGRALPSVGE